MKKSIFEIQLCILLGMNKKSSENRGKNPHCFIDILIVKFKIELECHLTDPNMIIYLFKGLEVGKDI